LFGGERKKKQERKGEKRKSDGEVMVENRNGTRLMRRERSRFCEKRDQDILNNPPPPPPHNRENPKEMLESRKHNPTDPEPIFQKNQALFAYPLTRKREARKVSKMNTSSHTPKQASK